MPALPKFSKFTFRLPKIQRHHNNFVYRPWLPNRSSNPWKPLAFVYPDTKKRESRENRTKSRKEYFLSSVDFHFSSCAGCVSLCVFVAQFSRLHRLKPQSHKPISHGELEQGARGGAGCRRHCFRQSLVGKDSQPCMTLPLALLMRKMSKEIEKIQRTHKLTRYTG